MSSGLRRKPGAGSSAAAARRRRQEGLETGPDGGIIGRDPRRLSPPELRELGHRGKPLLQVMRRRCVDCCGGKVDEVRRCTAVACPLWPYRMGTDPWHADADKPAREPEPNRAPAAASRPAAKAPPTPPPAVPDASRAESPPVVPKEATATAPAAAPERRPRPRAQAPRLPFLDDVTT